MQSSPFTAHSTNRTLETQLTKVKPITSPFRMSQYAPVLLASTYLFCYSEIVIKKSQPAKLAKSCRTIRSYKSSPPKFLSESSHKLIILIRTLLLVTLGLAGCMINQILRPKEKFEQTLTIAQNPTCAAMPASVPITHWKTFSNSKLGFSIKYPSRLANPKTIRLSTRTEVNFNNALTVAIGGYYDQVLHRMLKFEEFLKRFFSGQHSEDFGLGKMQGKHFVYQASGGQIEDVLVASESISSTEIWVITFRYHPDDCEAPMIFNKILSSFKLLD